MGDGADVVIDRIGAKGDGVAQTPTGPIYVPFALPGERWHVEDGGAAAARLAASPERADPICRHFGRCGGCVAQHMSDTLYADWKRAIVVDAFAHRGLKPEILPLQRIKAGSRRRAFLGVERRGSEVVIGFREEGRHTLVDMTECPVLDPAIVAALPSLREVARTAMPDEQGGRLIVTRTDGGLDVAFDNGIKPLPPEVRARLAKMAEHARLARLTVAGEIIIARAPATITLDGIAVEAPQSMFLQAVPEAERLLIDLVMAALPKKVKRVADLFSGLGTFAFALSRRAQVLAVDSDKRAVAALSAAARHASGLKPIETRVRDLFRDPMAAKELEAFDCVVFDPPRAGAEEQARRLAKSKVPVVIAVSCAPATLARDARILIDGGFRIGPVTPVDQFLYSPHVEAVAAFTR